MKSSNTTIQDSSSPEKTRVVNTSVVNTSVEKIKEDLSCKIAYYKAFLKAQAEFPDIPKSKSGARGKYADLGDILKVIEPILHKNGICVEQDIVFNDNYQECVKTTLTHALSGYSSVSIAIIPYQESDFKNKITCQVHGSGQTYFRRYVLASKLCLYAEEDTDGYSTENSYKKTNSFVKSNESNFF